MAKETKKSTYGDQLQYFIEHIDHLRDIAEAMRDYASGYEKEPFNRFRGDTPDLMIMFKRLRDSLSDDRYSMPMTNFFPNKPGK